MTDPLPFYKATGQEVTVFEHAYELRQPLLLKGPTGVGKSRFVEYMAKRLGRPLVTVACHDDTSATDLLGRFLIRGGDTVWQDGPVTRAVREGAILYLDEFAEARSDVVVVLHPLADFRRRIYIDRLDQELVAAEGFMLVASYNPGYQHRLKEIKPSTRQRFVGLSFNYPTPELEIAILLGETQVDKAVAKRLVSLASNMRKVEALGLAEVPSTRLLVETARLIVAGMPPRLAAAVALVEPLSDDLDVIAALNDAVALVF
ncbi:MAG TPA: CbbQ/NirQ/NorQ/GpvN family protein [Polyangiaceae bacterium]|nr:CbbQ/NirQ/NorQ/GpvN family protein [Polyangiaceae bacterium]